MTDIERRHGHFNEVGIQETFIICRLIQKLIEKEKNIYMYKRGTIPKPQKARKRKSVAQPPFGSPSKRVI